MKRIFVFTVAGFAAVAVFAGLVHTALVASGVSEPASVTIYGPTVRRLWASTVALLGLAGAIVGGLALARPSSRLGTASGQLGATVALVAGVIAVINGSLTLAMAKGGPGTGNGVVGGAVALVLGSIAVVLGALALARCRRGRLTSRSADE